MSAWGSNLCTKNQFTAKGYVSSRVQAAAQKTMDEQMDAATKDLVKNNNFTNECYFGADKHTICVDNEGSATQAMRRNTLTNSEDAGLKAAKDQGKSTGAIIGCVMALATGTKYTLEKPNKDEHDELEDLEELMNEKENQLKEEQAKMEAGKKEADELQTRAEEITKKNEEEVKEKQEKIDENKEEIADLNDKAQTEGLTDLEKARRTTLQEEAGEITENIQETTNTTNENVNNINENINDIKDDIDAVQETTDTVQDIADYAESFDKATKTMAIVEAASQGMNAVSGTKSGIQAISLATSGSWAFGATAWAYAVGAMGFAGAGMSTRGVVQQVGYVKDINKEIDVRKDTQTLNTQTIGVNDVSVDDVEDKIEKVETLAKSTDIEFEDPTPDTEVDTTEQPTDKEDTKEKEIV